MKKKRQLMIGLVLALVVTSGLYAFTYTSTTVATNVTVSDAAIATSAPSATQPGWGSIVPVSPDWAYRKKITIDHTKVDASLTDFPVLISITDSNLRDDAQDDGDDIKFTASDGTTQLDHEIENFAGDTGELVAWVRVPILSSSTDTNIYMYYGNATCASQENVEGAWETSFEMVQHLKDDPDTSHTKDSTSNNHDGTKKGVNDPIEADGNTGKAQDFSSDHISCGDLGIGNSYTAECWIKADTLTGTGDYDTYGFTIMASAASGQGYPLWLTVRGTEVRLWAYESTPSTGGWRETTGAGLNTTDKFYIAAIATHSSTTKVYVNGVERLSFTNDGDVNWTNIFTLGDLRPDRAIYFDGIIDETRISDVVRSADWIKACYNNQSSPSTFYSLEGAEETIAPALMGEVPTGNLFDIAPSSEYNGDLALKVYLTNTNNLTKAYDYLNVKLYLGGSVEAGETPNYQLLTLQNGEAKFIIQDIPATSGTWTQTSQSDFQGGTPNQVEAISPGDVILDTFSDNDTDTFDDETKIATKSNLVVSGGQVKLTAGGASEQEALRPIAAGDETDIAYEYPVWYDSSWIRRVPVTISNTGSALSDYQISVDVTYDSDMQPDFDDIRFADADGATLLSYWRETYTASTSATFWVNVPSVPAGTKDIFMYYGNVAVSTTSDGDATFEFYDDFEDGDISDWSSYGSGVVQIADDSGNYVLLKTANNDPNGGYSLFNNGALSDYEAVFRTKRINEDGGSQTRYGIEDGSYNGYGPRMYDFNSLPATFAIEMRTGGSSTNLVTKSTSAYEWDTWMTVKFRQYGTNLEFELYDYSGSLVESIATTDSSYNSFDRFVVHGGWEFYTDDIRVRQYTSTEPITSLGTEESEGGHWDKVDDATSDGDATYVYTDSSTWQEDLYDVSDHATGTGAINFVRVYMECRADASPAQTSAYVHIKTNSLEDNGSEETITTGYATYSDQWDTNPQTGNPWTWAEIDALQIGTGLREPALGQNTICTQVYVVVDYTAYDSPGTLTAINLLSGETVARIDSFDYNALAIPSGTSLRVQFSQDSSTWYDSAGNSGQWDTMSEGSHSIGLSTLLWSGANFYYQIEFTSDGSDTPVLEEITVNFSTYHASGDLTSSAYDTGYDFAWDWGTISFTIDEPSATNIQFQIRTAATEAGLSTATWYGPTGTGDYYTTSGTDTNPVHDGDRWVQYKAYFSGPGDDTPTLNDTSITYSAEAITYTITVTGGSYCLVSTDTSGWEAGWTVTPELYCQVVQR